MLDTKYEVFKDLKVLYVEDDNVSIKIISKILSRSFKEIFIGKDGEDGLKKFNNLADEIDLVITDIDMPIMNGVQMSRLIKEQRDVPIIFISAFKDEMYKFENMVEGIIEKPVIKEALFECIYIIFKEKNLI